MGTELKKKYGLVTAICMVVGIVIGSGVFFKAQNVLQYTQGNMPLGILAWVIGGIVIVVCSYNFATLANKYEKVNGLVDYAEATLGSRYAYMLGWFATTIYYPGMTSVLAWVSARYTLVLFGSDDITGGLCLALSCFYLCLSYAINALSPIIAGKFQVASTAVKLVPLIIMAIVGTIVGLKNGNTVSAFQTWNLVEQTCVGAPLFAAVVATAFAYEGWIIATSINAELKNSKKNLPIALVVGSLIIVAVYILYYIGLAGGAKIADLKDGAGAPTAFLNIFGNVGGTALNAMIVVSCLGTLNGLMVASTRSLYALSARNQGPKVKMFKEVSEETNMPTNASVFGLLVCAAWLFYFYGANLWGNPETGKPLFGIFSFDSSELPIITIYALYIPIFFAFMIKHGKENIFKNVIMPLIGIIASAFMVFAAVYAHGITPYLNAKANGEFSFPVLFYLIVFVVIMIIGAFFYKKGNKETK
ncbi:MAG: amino acid permease [Clostridia bacterium]|nr:amino acid permease [Clostridia bacterium]